MIPEIDIWRVANLMLTRYGDEAVAEGTKRAEELAADGDLGGVAVWLRVIDAISQLASQHRSGPYIRGTAAPAVGLEFHPMP